MRSGQPTLAVVAYELESIERLSREAVIGPALLLLYPPEFGRFHGFLCSHGPRFEHIVGGDSKEVVVGWRECIPWFALHAVLLRKGCAHGF